MLKKFTTTQPYMNAQGRTAKRHLLKRQIEKDIQKRVRSESIYIYIGIWKGFQKNAESCDHSHNQGGGEFFNLPNKMSKP